MDKLSGRRLRLWLILLGLTISVGACVSAKKLFEEGIDLQNQGRFREAAVAYIEALRKDPALEGARDRLQEAGQEAVDQDLAQSEGLHEVGRHREAAAHLRSIDELVVDAASVDVTLQLPDDYSSRRRESFDRAIEQLMTEGEEAVEGKRWEKAISLYRTVGDFEPGAAQRETAHAAHTQALILWGEDDLAAGRYRSALAHADEAIGRSAGQDGRNAAADLRRRVIEVGTLVVAFTPVALPEGIDAPRYFVHELNEELMVNRWSDPPVLVASSDPISVRQAIQGRGRKDIPLSPKIAGDIARELDADFAFIGTITKFNREERDKKKERVNLQTRSGGDAEFLRFSADLHVQVEIAFSLVEAGKVTAVKSAKVSGHESDKIRWAEYDGDYRDLVVSREDFALFDEERRNERVEAIEGSLISELADKLSRKGYEAIFNVMQ